MASPGGYASKAVQAARADKVKRLYQEGVTCTVIAERLGMSVSTVTDTATKLGLRRPLDRRPKKAC